MPDAGAPVGTFDEKDAERRTFRHLLVGAIIARPSRITWVLDRHRVDARLRVLCQLGVDDAKLGMSLDGKENDEAIWEPAVETVYLGRRSGDAYALTAVAGAVDVPDCEALPATMKLTCKAESVAVRPAGAALVPVKSRDNSAAGHGRWKPGTREQVAAERCELTNDKGDPALRGHAESWRLVFAKAAGRGIEWAFVNSDMVIQEGGYRWMPTGKAENR